ncbi:MAG: hypothetical protein AAFV45_15325 [Pseudomonadota bacterium]
MTQRHPLQWPVHVPRTKRRDRSKFNSTLAKARDGLLDDIRLLGGIYPIISPDLKTQNEICLPCRWK